MDIPGRLIPSFVEARGVASSSTVSGCDSERDPDPNGNFRRTDPALPGFGTLGDWGGLNSGGDGGVGDAIVDLEETAAFEGAGVETEVDTAGAAARAAWMRGTAVAFEAGFKEFV